MAEFEELMTAEDGVIVSVEVIVYDDDGSSIFKVSRITN